MIVLLFDGHQLASSYSKESQNYTELGRMEPSADVAANPAMAAGLGILRGEPRISSSAWISESLGYISATRIDVVCFSDSTFSFPKSLVSHMPA